MKSDARVESNVAYTGNAFNAIEFFSCYFYCVKLELIAALSASIGLRNDSVQSMIISLKNIAGKRNYKRDSFKQLAQSVISDREAIKGLKNIIYHDYSRNPVPNGSSPSKETTFSIELTREF